MDHDKPQSHTNLLTVTIEKLNANDIMLMLHYKPYNINSEQLSSKKQKAQQKVKQISKNVVPDPFQLDDAVQIQQET